jgi:hypothetical protein
MFSSNTSSAASDANFVEEVFSTWLYTGNGSTQTITNGIDLAGKGGLVWTKNRVTTNSHRLIDTNRGINNAISSNSTAAATTGSGQVTAFNSNGYDLGADSDYNNSAAGSNYASWTFREQPKFFDVVTYTGNSSNPRAIPHSLGSIPGVVIVKRVDATGDWRVYHRDFSFTDGLRLNGTEAVSASYGVMSAAPTDTTFTPVSGYNLSGATYVAYLFAHNAGGFGLSGTDNVISCGSFTTDGSGNATVNLGYEPQWVLVKPAGATGNWDLMDTMRGFSQTSVSRLQPNTSSAEGTVAGNYLFPTATGFELAQNFYGLTSTQFIYIAIRRGPMKVPTDGTKVYNASTRTAAFGSTGIKTGSGFPIDGLFSSGRDQPNNDKWMIFDRLRGNTQVLRSNGAFAEANFGNAVTGLDLQDGYRFGADNVVGLFNGSYEGATYVDHYFRRAPGFFDEVCFTTAGSRETNLRVSHNLAAVPELIIVKDRTAGANWTVYSGSINQLIILNSTAAIQTVTNAWGTSAPTSSNFGLDTINFVSAYGDNMAAYLFATCPGVSKVGSYTGTATTLQINCGFAAGARFVMIKRTDSTGDWYVWDSARGIVSGNDPYLTINNTVTEVTSTDYIDTFSAGFEITSTAPSAINASGGAFIFLAIA